MQQVNFLIESFQDVPFVLMRVGGQQPINHLSISIYV